MRDRLRFILLAAAWLYPINIEAQDFAASMPEFIAPVSCKKPSSTLFESDSIVNIIIIADFKGLLRNRTTKPQYRNAKIYYFTPDTVPVYVEVKVRQRGNFRRQSNICSFPPLAINFKKSTVGGSLFEGQDKIKLVTHCRERDDYEQNVLKEYLAYKIYNELTDFSYRVRLAKVTYIDSSGRRKPISRYGFFVESQGEFEQRNCVSLVPTKNLHQEAVDRFQMTLVSVFQYLIGNTDWSVPNRHNIDLYLGHVQNPFIPVTYDFDFSGLVDAPYAFPQPMLGIKRVTTRLYRGFQRDSLEIHSVLNVLNLYKDEIISAADFLTPLKNRPTRQVNEYLFPFFTNVRDESFVRRVFIDGSRKIE